MASTHAGLRNKGSDLTLLVGFLSVCVGVGIVSTERRQLALGLVVLALMGGLIAVRPVMAAVVAVPAMYGYQGVGLGGGLGVSDLAVILAALLALPALATSEELRRLGRVNRAFAAYVLLLLPSLISHHTAEADREVVHRVILVAGAALLGAWLVKERAENAALRLLVVVSAGLALVSVFTAARTGFSPAEPFGYNKNYIGSFFALTLMITLCAPSHLGLKASLRAPAIAVLIAGTLACQSRGAILGAALGGVLWLFAPREGTAVSGRSRVAALVLAVSFAGYAGYSVHQQLTSKDAKTNSAGVRRDTEAFARDLWRSSPATGVGIRYFNTGEFGPKAVAPNNAFDTELAESGLLGTLGFTVLHATVFLALWRRRNSQLGLAALAVLAGQFLHGQVDIYWSSGLTAFCFILVGMALAATAPRQKALVRDSA